MGYYSQVALCVSEKIEVPKETLSIMKSIDFHLVGTYKGNRLFVIEQVKWYDSYPEIAHLIEFMDSLDNEGCRYNEYLFRRIGEDFEDIESRGSYYQNPFNLGIECCFVYEPLNDAS